MYFIYSIKLAFKSIWHEKWINVLTVLTIATGLFIISLTTFTVYNINLGTKKLPEKFSMMVYLDDKTSEQEAENITATLKKNKSIEWAKYISKDKALSELRGVLKNADYVLEGINENPLSASIEVKLRESDVTAEKAKNLAGQIKMIKGVADVEYGEQFLNSIHSIKAGAQTIGLLLIITMSAGIIFICYSTVKIMFYRRKEEIETFKLLGATKGFIRAPFVLEGGMIGTASGILSMFCAIAFHSVVFKKLVQTMPIFKVIVFPSEMFIALPLIGLILGVSGSIIALGRIRFS